ncbi:MAG: hypothetical protein KGY81_09165 [Phycisphaerae bacterium]|nr:hypothetical protein [Phycisphaerae bacterium]
MRNTLLDLGLDGTSLEIRVHEAGDHEVVKTFTGADLRELVELLDELAEKIRIAERRGLTFQMLLDNRTLAEETKHLTLPTHWIVVNGKNLFFSSREKYNEFMDKRAERLVDEALENGNGEAEDPDDDARMRRIQKRAELHEVKDMERIITKLKHRGISIDDYYAAREESVTGELAPAKYVLVTEDESLDVDNVAGIAPGVRELGSRGIEIKRFKGLGEMNAEQLWETTMDPEKRMLMRVRAEEAEEAERMFSLLMGDNVERRRQFIEDNALAVKNLDV